MIKELYSEGIKHLSSILRKAQGRPDAETKADIDIGYEVMRLRAVLDGMNVKPQLPQDVEEFIAGNSQTDHIRDEYGDTHYKIDVVDVDDLRAWMAGHVRVPVELIENTLGAVREELSKADNAAYPVCCGQSGHECCGCPEPEWPPHAIATKEVLGPIEKELSSMLNASKEKQ